MNAKVEPVTVVLILISIAYVSWVVKNQEPLAPQQQPVVQEERR